MQPTNSLPYLLVPVWLLLFGQGGRPSSTVADLKRTPAYRSAQTRFTAGDFRGALRAIDTLSHRPGLSPAERRFLERQRSICRKALRRP